MMRTKPARVAPGKQQGARANRKSPVRPVVEPAVAKLFRQLPSSRRRPEYQRAKDRQHEHKSEHFRIEGQIEQIEGQAA